MENIKKVKEYDARIIASIIENAFLCNNENEIFNCAEDIINEEVDILNYREKSTKVIEEIKRQCPYIKRITPYPMDNLNSALTTINSGLIPFLVAKSYIFPAFSLNVEP